MQSRTRKLAALFAASGLALSALAPAASADPKPFQGYYKNVNGGGNGESECAGPHPEQLPPGQAKKCD